jgi:hypothetical protein
MLDDLAGIVNEPDLWRGWGWFEGASGYARYTQPFRRQNSNHGQADIRHSAFYLSPSAPVEP